MGESTTLAQDLASNINLQAITGAVQPYVPFIAGALLVGVVFYIIRKVTKKASKTKFGM